MSHIDLVALIVRDYDAVIRFFVDVLQFELRAGVDDIRFEALPD